MMIAMITRIGSLLTGFPQVTSFHTTDIHSMVPPYEYS